MKSRRSRKLLLIGAAVLVAAVVSIGARGIGATTANEHHPDAVSNPSGIPNPPEVDPDPDLPMPPSITSREMVSQDAGREPVAEFIADVTLKFDASSIEQAGAALRRLNDARFTLMRATVRPAATDERGIDGWTPGASPFAADVRLKFEAASLTQGGAVLRRLRQFGFDLVSGTVRQARDEEADEDAGSTPYGPTVRDDRD